MFYRSSSEFKQLQAQLASEQRQVAELNRELSRREIQNKEDKNVLQNELEKLRSSNEQLQAEMSEAREQLAEMELSMKKATNTVTLLKKVRTTLLSYIHYIFVIIM